MGRVGLVFSVCAEAGRGERRRGMNMKELTDVLGHDLRPWSGSAWRKINVLIELVSDNGETVAIVNRDDFNFENAKPTRFADLLHLAGYSPPLEGVSETNWQRCLRLAREIGKTELIRKLLKYIAEKESKVRHRSKLPLWSIVGEATCHGSGVSSAIVELYYPEGGDS